jgi:hypothetical protein
MREGERHQLTEGYQLDCHRLADGQDLAEGHQLAEGWPRPPRRSSRAGIALRVTSSRRAISSTATCSPRARTSRSATGSRRVGAAAAVEPGRDRAERHRPPARRPQPARRGLAAVAVEPGPDLAEGWPAAGVGGQSLANKKAAR